MKFTEHDRPADEQTKPFTYGDIRITSSIKTATDLLFRCHWFHPQMWHYFSVTTDLGSNCHLSLTPLCEIRNQTLVKKLVIAGLK